jgi:hypothetical protein
LQFGQWAALGEVPGFDGALSAVHGPEPVKAGRQRAHLLLLPRLRAPPRSSAATTKQARHSAAEARRDPSAASAARYPDAERANALPAEVVHVLDVLALAPQLRCAETGRPARGTLNDQSQQCRARVSTSEARPPAASQEGHESGLAGCRLLARGQATWAPYAIMLLDVRAPTGGPSHSRAGPQVRRKLFECLLMA